MLSAMSLREVLRVTRQWRGLEPAFDGGGLEPARPFRLALDKVGAPSYGHVVLKQLEQVYCVVCEKDLSAAQAC
jgi:hypothetical protein